MIRYCTRVCCIIIFILYSQTLFSKQQPVADGKILEPVTRTIAITNATVIQSPGKKIEKATVIIRNGLINAVGMNISVPPDAIHIKADSFFVYAGFIDGLSRAGVTKPKVDANRERTKDPGNPEPEMAGITPQNDVRSFLNPNDKSVEDLRAIGFTTAQVVPYGNMFPGSGSVIQLTGKSADAMVLVSNSILFSELVGVQRVYPSTILAVMAKWRELYRQAQQAKNYENLYTANPKGLNRPASDRILEAFYPVIDKRIPVLFEADKYLEIQRALTLQTELGFSCVLGDLKEGWDAISKIKSAGAKVFLSLDLPEEKKDEKDTREKKEAKPEAEKSQPLITLTQEEKVALEKRKAESISLHVGQAVAFQKAGMPFGFSTLTAKPSDIKANMRRILKAGLTEDQLLAALTTSPAQMLGLADRLGSVENGKIANLVLTDKPYFEEKSKIRYVFVDGVMYKYDPKETPKPAVDLIDITGTWTVTTESPTGKSEASVTFTKEGTSYGGSITGKEQAQAITLDPVEFSGKNLKYSYTVNMEGQTFKVDVQVTVEGNSFNGTATVGQYGTYPVEGKKDPKK